MKAAPESQALSANNRLLKLWETVVSERGDAPAVWRARDRTIHSFADLAARAEAMARKLPASLCGYTVAFSHEDGLDWLAAFLALRSRQASLLAMEHQPGKQLPAINNESCIANAVLDENGFRWLSEIPSPPSETALFKLTSASTGTAKALPFREAELIADGDNICPTMGIQQSDRNFALLPLAHSYALGNLVLPLLTQGVPLCLGSSQLPSAVEEELAWSEGTIFPTVPAVLNLLVRSRVGALPSLRRVISAAAPLSPELARRFLDRFSLGIHNFYGSSETGGIAYDRTGKLALTGAAIGTALDGVALALDPTGRLEVKSPAVSYALGETAGCEGRRFLMADRAELFDDGCIRLLGRVDCVIKHAGRRYDLNELESCFQKTLDSTEVALIYCADRARFELFVPPSQAARTKEKLRQEFPHLSPRTKVLELLSLPRTPRGKIDLTSLRAIALKND